MAKIGEVLSGAEGDFTVEKPIAGIGVRMTITDAVLEAATTRAAIISALETINSQGTVGVSYVSKDGKRRNPFNAQGILTLLELAQNFEGVIRLEDQATANEWTLEGIIPLSESGAIQFNNDETLEINCNVAAGKIDKIEFYTVENAVAAWDFVYLEKLSVLNGQTEKKFDVSAHDKVMIPLSAITATTDIDFEYTNGKTPRFDQNILPMVSDGINDICYNKDGIIVSGAGIFAILDVSAVSAIEISRASTSAFDIIAQKTEIVQNLKQVQRVNQKLEATTLSKYDVEARKQRV